MSSEGNVFNLGDTSEQTKQSASCRQKYETCEKSEQRTDIEHPLCSPQYNPLFTSLLSCPSSLSKSSNFVRHSTRPIRKCRLMRPAPLDLSSVLRLFGIRLNSVNANFSATLAKQLRGLKLRGIESKLLETINEQVTCIKQAFCGLLVMTDVPDVPVDNNSEPDTTDTEEPHSPFKRVPEAKWVYKTPCKQRNKSINELSLKSTNSCVPAVLYERTIYELRQSHSSLCSNQHIPNNIRYLGPECTLTTQNRAFLQSDIDAWYESCPPAPEIEKLTWYEASCRSRNIQGDRFQKSIGFQILTSTTKLMSSRIRSFDETRFNEGAGMAQLPCKLPKLERQNELQY